MADSSTVSKQTLYLSIMLALIAGFIGGVVFTIHRTGGQEEGQAPLANQEAQAILNLEAEVTAHPDNTDAWIQLAHLYFDTSQLDKAIGAYNKALEKRPGDANLWTDLGVMYRRKGGPEKALECFDKAAGLDPTHLQSRFNRGVVLYFDLKKPDEAYKAWESVLALNNDYRTGDGQLLRDFLASVRAEAAQ